MGGGKRFVVNFHRFLLKQRKFAVRFLNGLLSDLYCLIIIQHGEENITAKKEKVGKF